MLIKDQSHCDILLMHLMKKYHGLQGVLNLLSDRYSNCWKSFSFLVLLKGKLKVCNYAGELRSFIEQLNIAKKIPVMPN